MKTYRWDFSKILFWSVGTDQNCQLFESSNETEQEAVLTEEDSTSEYLSSSPEARVKKVKNCWS